jgi:hypothetical protein
MRAAVPLVGAFILIVAFPLAGFAQHGGVCYDASLGTPEAQGWTYHDDVGGNPLPYVSGGPLHETATAGGQYWGRQDVSIDFSQHVTHLRPEYDLSKLTGGVRGKYYQLATAGTTLVLLEPDVAEAFPDGETVNQALRALIKVAQTKVRRSQTKLANTALPAASRTRKPAARRRKRARAARG